MAIETDKTTSTRETTSELMSLVWTYFRQETVDPLKGLVRFLAFGVAGAAVMTIGVLLLVLALVRALQTELGAHLTGNLTWVPYVAGIVLALVVAGLAATRIRKGVR